MTKQLICILLHGGVSHQPSKKILEHIDGIDEITRIKIETENFKQKLIKSAKIKEIPCFLLKIGNKTQVVPVTKSEYILSFFN